MPEERWWAAVVSEETYAAERLYAFDTLVLPGAGGPRGPRAGDHVVLIASGEPAMLFGVGQVRAGRRENEDVTVRYTHRLFDEPIPISEPPPLGLTELPAVAYERLVAQVDGANGRTDTNATQRDATEWFVSVALPIEAPSPAEAVREFWTYVEKLGPRELPAYVWPPGDELAMRAFVLGTETNLDPEEDDAEP
jgi:hypothetical protein